MPPHTIGQASERLGLTPDTLRYYEKCGLLPPIARTSGGKRQYSEADLARLRFIRRAQKMHFSLAQISDLLALRDDPGSAQPQVRQLARAKLREIEDRLLDLGQLRDELSQLIRACESGTGECCPILEGIEHNGQGRSQA